MAVQMGKYSEIVDVCQQKYILCPEICSTPPDLYFCSKNIFICPWNYSLCHRNIFNLPGFLFHCLDFSFCSPKTFLCSAEIEVYPPEFYLLPQKYLVHPIYFVSHARIFFDSGHFGQAVMPWLLNDPDRQLRHSTRSFKHRLSETTRAGQWPLAWKSGPRDINGPW